MTLGIRKIIIISLVAGIFLTANVWIVVNWLQDHGVIDWVQHIRSEYLTGTALTIIIVLLILLVRPRGERAKFIRSCPVCDHTLLGRGKYCSECGSRV